MQAWLDAYHEVVSGHEGVLVSGDLSGRAGLIQAAINLELHSMYITSIDVKVSLFNFIFLFAFSLELLFDSNFQISD